MTYQQRTQISKERRFLQVECTYCGAAEGERCKTFGTQMPESYPHQTRRYLFYDRVVAPELLKGTLVCTR